MNKESCLAEQDTDRYITGNIDAESKERIEAHIFECDFCREKVAHCALLLSNETLTSAQADSELLRQTAATAAGLVTVQPAPGGRPPNVQPLFKPAYKPYLLIAASIIVLFMIAAGLFMLRNSINIEMEAERNMKELNTIARQQRFCEYRITGIEYSSNSSRGSSYTTSIDKIAAIHEATLSLINRSPKTNTRHILARILIIEGNLDRAIVELNQLRLSAANDINILNDLAVANALKGNITEAIAQLTQALTIEPAFKDALFNRGLLYQSINRNDAARADWQRYLAIDATSPWAQEVKNNLSSL